MRDFGDRVRRHPLPVYLIALGFSPLEIGAIATAALVGSALLTFGIGMIGSRHDRQRLLLAGASLMTATGVAFAVVHDFALLLVVAFAGTLNPSAGSVSIFVPLEHAVLRGEVSDRRPDRDVCPLQPHRRPERRLRRARRDQWRPTNCLSLSCRSPGRSL